MTIIHSDIAAGGEPVAPAPLRVLIGDHPEWRPQIEVRLDRRLFAPTFLGDLGGEADLRGFDMVCPLVLRDYDALRRAIAEGRGGDANLLMPDRETVARLHDKRRFAEWMEALGQGDLLPPQGASQRFPCVVKPARGAFGEHIRIARSAGELADLTQRIGPVAVQPFVPGQVEYATHVLASRGQVSRMLTVEYTMPSEGCVKGRQMRPQSSRWIETPFAGRFAALVKAMRYSGACCIDYKIAEGRPFIFEINPRVGASLALRPNVFLVVYQAALSQGCFDPDPDMVSADPGWEVVTVTA